MTVNKMYSKDLLSKEIAAFYKNIKIADCLNDAERYFNSNHTFNFKEIYLLILTETKKTGENQLLDFNNLNYEDFLGVFQKISRIFRQSEVIFKSANIEALNVEWLGDKHFICATPNNSNEHGTEHVEQILLLTAMLEFALGSIFYTLSGSKTPPHLLKDLLCTNELEAFFGTEALTFLKLIIGTPKAINLRNIVWHGFPKPQEIPTFYVPTLLLVIHSLGHLLQAKEFQLVYRKQILGFSMSLTTVCRASNMPTNFIINENSYHATIASCPLIPEDYKLYWRQLYIYLQKAVYWRFVILILPQIELILRLLYAKFNEFDISAKLDEYYITMDTIFEPIVPQTANQQNGFFSETCDISMGALHFMYDIFLAPKGPRLRDKISHGEASMEAINEQQLCQTLLYLAFNLMTQNELNYPLAEYESQFHINSLTKLSLNKTTEKFKQFKQTFKIVAENDLSLNLITTNVYIFQRPKKEQFFMPLIMKIANLLSETCDNYEESIRLRQTLLAQHELHSKRRRTLENLMKTLPTFCSFLNLALKCLLEIYTKLQMSLQDFKVEDEICLQRFLKHTLKIAENLVKYAHKENNEWIKISELSKAFQENYEKLYLKFRENCLKDAKFQN